MSNKSEIASFDLSSLDTADEAEMEVRINGKLSGWRLRFAGPGHQKSIQQENRLARENLERRKAQERAQVNGRKWKPEDETVEEVIAKNIQLIVERLIDWTPVTLDGEPYPFSPENARKLLSDPKKGTILTQCLDFLGDETIFTKRSATN
ncbi:hypothetical protein [Hyphomicrobium sp. DY-1]|uniref:hypothetical protein n=1 Tax=Hyphomicrobium sp. DY-1 TaxID=3075650 RepID=UPI0039C1ABFE